MQRVLVYGLAAGLGLAACQNASFFTCSDDANCVDGDAVGQCEPNGACSFPHDGCESGRRYGDNGDPALAGACVEIVGTTGGIATSDSGMPPVTTSTTSSGATGDATDDGPGDDTAADACPSDWWDCAWSHRQRLSIAVPAGGPFSDVPVLVLLTEGRVEHGLMQADGEDLRFVQADGIEAAYEVESFDPKGISRIWVRLDDVSPSADHLWLYYGNAVAEGNANAAAVWAAPFAGVWHLQDEPALDATGNGGDAVENGNTAVVPGQVGGARDFVGGNPRLDVAASPALADLFANGGTVSAWFRARGYGGGDFGRIVHKGNGTVGWLFYVGGGGRLRLALDAIGGAFSTPAGAFELEQWVHAAVTFDPATGESPRLFVDGVEQELEPDPPAVPPDLGSDLDVAMGIGNQPSNGRAFDGILDEVRLQKAARSPAWIGLQHQSMRDELLTFGGIETHGGVQ